MVLKLIYRILEEKRIVALLGFFRRQFLLKMLPKDSIGVEIGVHKGEFSAQILRIVNPKELHLIDPWKHEESEMYKDALYGGMAQGQAEMQARYEAVLKRFQNDID